MHRFLGWVTAGVGLTVLIAGLAGAAYVEDDIVMTPQRSVIADGTRAVVSSPKALAYKGSTVIIKATGSRGDTFIGLAHRVDVTDYLGEVPRVEVSGLRPTGDFDRRVLPGKNTKPVAPQKLDIWQRKVSGVGTQTLRLALAGEPVQLVLMAPAGSDVRLQVGAMVPGIRRAALVVAAGGLGLLLTAAISGLWTLVRRRRRNRAQRDADPVPYIAAHSAHDGLGQEAAPLSRRERAADRRSSRPRPRADSPSVMQRAVVSTLRLSVIGICAVVAAGSITPPEKTPVVDAPRRPAIRGAYSMVLTDADKRANAAYKAIVTTHDTKTLGRIFRDSELARRTFDAQYAKVSESKHQLLSITSHELRVFAGSFDHYPMWFIGTSDVLAQRNDKKGRYTGFTVFRRDGVETPWTISESCPTDTPALLEPRDAGDESTASRAERQRALGVAKAVMEYLRTGRTSQIAPDDVMKDFRRDAVKLDAYTARAELKADFGRKAKDQTGTDGSVKVVRTEQGLLAAVSLDVRNTVIAQPDAYFTWKEAFATLYRDTSRHTTLTRRSAMVAFVGITKGRPKVVCSDWGSVL